MMHWILKRWYLFRNDLQSLLLLLTTDILYFISLFAPIVTNYRIKLRRRLHKNHKLLLRFGDCAYLCRISDINTLIEMYDLKEYQKEPHFMPKVGDLVVDVGANIGEYAIWAAKVAGPQGRVIAFEPNPHAISLLRRNVTLNGLKNVTIITKAVHAKKGTVKIYTCPETTSSDSVLPISKQSYMTKAMTLDSALSQERRIDLIKMDIEGAEYLALQGAHQVLRKKKPRIIVELHTRPIQKHVLTLLKSFGYHIVRKDIINDWLMIAYLEIL